MSFIPSVIYGECHYDECHYDECHYAECHYAECHYAEFHYAEFHYAECHYAECHYAECRHTECCSVLQQPICSDSEAMRKSGKNPIIFFPSFKPRHNKLACFTHVFFSLAV